MPISLQKGIEYRVELHSRSGALLNTLRLPSAIDDEFLSNYQNLYERILRSTKVVPKESLRDPTWGLGERLFGLILDGV